jgi:acetyl esterase/lipase
LVLKDEGDALPAAAFFLSPQTDWVRFDGKSYSTRADVDFWYSPKMFSLTASQYVGDHDPETPLLSPVHVDMAGLPPLCIHVGDNDVLLSDSVRFARRARASGVAVELKIWRGVWHVFQTSARFVPEARQSIDEIGRFVVHHIDDTALGDRP